MITKEPAGHWQTATLVQAVACDGIRAAMLLDVPMNGVCFAEFCRRWLAPSLEPGDLVLMDNLSAHKSTEALEAIRSAGAGVLWLPRTLLIWLQSRRSSARSKNTFENWPHAVGTNLLRSLPPLSTQSLPWKSRTASNPADTTSD
ncbi:transposase [Thalassoglobus sp. JC818]|uniref:transposase n=1 Tax=Thalassoglobus sp. JC818 TaxID=3232136 RepID=UPI00345A9C1A